MPRCASCKGALKKGTVVHTAKVGDVRFRAELPASVCEHCAEDYVDAEQLGRFELLAAQRLAEAGTRSPEVFRFLRKVLGLRAADVATVIGVRPETVSRYENGSLDIDPHRWAILCTVVIDKAAGRDDALQRFRAAEAGPIKKLPRRIQLKVA